VETENTFVVDVVVDQVTNLGAYEFTLSFDPTIVAYQNVVNGGFLGSSGRQVSCLTPTVTASSVRFGCITLGAEPEGPSGSGVLARVILLAVGPGTSPLDLSGVILTVPWGTVIPAAEQDGSVTVLLGPTATPCPDGICPTATTTPTITSTPTKLPASTIVRIDPPSSNVLTGAIFTVDVAVDAVSNLGAYEFQLNFDPNVITFVSVADASFLGSTGRGVFCPEPSVADNRFHFGCATSGPEPPGPSGSGVLSVVTFRAVGAGVSPLELVNVALADPMGRAIPVTVQGGNVFVSWAPTPTPTPCPGGICPTATPTPTATQVPPPTPTPVPVSCAPVSGTAVCVQPPDQTVFSSTDFTVSVVADKVTNLGAYEFTLAFDPAVVSFVSVADASFLGSTGRQVHCLAPILTGSSVRLTCVTLGAKPSGPSGSGTLARVTLNAAAAGTSALDLQDVILLKADVSATPLPLTEQDGSVTVVLGPTPTPTITPTPTNTPTPGPSPTPTSTPELGCALSALTAVCVHPVSQTVPLGPNFTVNIVVDDVTNLGSYEWQLAFDPTIVGYVDVVNSSFMGSTGRTIFCPGPIISADSVRFGCASSDGATPGPDGTAVLSTVTFSTIAEGTSPLDLIFASLSDPLGDDIPAEAQDGSVTVSASVAAPTGHMNGGEPRVAAAIRHVNLSQSEGLGCGYPWGAGLVGGLGLLLTLTRGLALPLLRGTGPCSRSGDGDNRSWKGRWGS